MSARIESRMEACRSLWDRFSPRESLFDLWEFRLPFWEVYRFEPHFVVLERGGEVTGLLPLWFEPEQKQYLWFGDTGDGCNWQEGTDIWAQAEEDVMALLDACPRPALLTSIRQACYERWHSSVPFTNGDAKSRLPLDHIHSVEEYLQSLPRKLRSNLRRDQRAVDTFHPVMVSDDWSTFQDLLRLNTAKFADSPFHDPRTVQVFERLIRPEHPVPYSVTIIAARIEEDIAAADLIFHYNGVAYSLLCGSDTRRFPGIGHVMTLLDIQDAIRRSCSAVDFAEYEGENNYKSKLFPSLPQYTLTLPVH
ncbi:MAG: GNAT family N-acetyltransferase [Candidatus Peribacteraceae bacterium]|nr:GNAT family N-acetyltransferase [Candidatus Peribacteraceae bacterium]